MKKVLVINLGWEQQKIIRLLAKREDVDLYGINADKHYDYENLFTEVKVCDLRDFIAIFNFVDKVKPDAVISDQCDYSLLIQAVISNRLKLNGPSIESAQLSNNKYFQRLKLSNKNVSMPRYKLCSSPEDVKLFCKESGYPVITKPIDNRGSFGVEIINEESGIEQAYYKSFINSHSGLILVEEQIIGKHYIVDGYSFGKEHQSLAVGKKELLDNNFMNKDIVYYSEDDYFSQRLKKYNDYVVSELGYDFGHTTSEYIVTHDEEIFLVESANRGGGVFISSHIVNNISGIDINQAYINDCMCESYTEIKNVEKIRCLRLYYFLPEQEGVISKIKKKKSSNEINILKYYIWAKPGDFIKMNIENASNRLGVAIIRCDNEDSHLLPELSIEFK